MRRASARPHRPCWDSAAGWVRRDRSSVRQASSAPGSPTPPGQRGPRRRPLQAGLRGRPGADCVDHHRRHRRANYLGRSRLSSATPGNSRRSSTAAANSPPRSKAARIAAASISDTLNMPASMGLAARDQQAWRSARLSRHPASSAARRAWHIGWRHRTGQPLLRRPGDASSIAVWAQPGVILGIVCHHSAPAPARTRCCRAASAGHGGPLVSDLVIFSLALAARAGALTRVRSASP